MPIEYRNIQSPDISHKIPYQIELYSPSKHIGGVSHIAYYSCGFWRTADHKLICLHRDVKAYAPANTACTRQGVGVVLSSNDLGFTPCG